MRLASRRDLEALRALCHAAVGEDDYVLAYLPEMVAAGEVVVAEGEGGVVAMAGVSECADRALWIGQMRTHPDFRRRGFARVLLAWSYARAGRERRPALRLWASESNVASRALFETTGFRHVGTFTRVQAPALEDGSALRPARDARGTYSRWRRSLFSRRAQGYVAYQWHFLPLTVGALRAMARRGELLAGPQGALLLWTGEDDVTVYASILAGGEDALLAARRAAHARDRTRAEVFVPRDEQVIEWTRAAGYAPAEWGTRAMLYEWSIGS